MEQKKIIYSIFAIYILLLSGCIKEQSSNNNLYVGDRLPMSMRVLNTKATNAEEQIHTTRIVVFSNSGELVYNQIVEPELSVGDEKNFWLEVARGVNHFYIFCNENEELTTKLNALKQQSEVDKITFSVSSKVDEIPMYCKIADAVVTADKDGSNVTVTVGNKTTTSLDVVVTRLLAKINMTVIKNVPTGVSDFAIKKLYYRVCRMPKYMTIGEGAKYPQGAGWATNIDVLSNGEIAIGSNGDYIVSGDTRTVPAGQDFITTPTIYIHEHILEKEESADYCTYLLISAECESEYSSSVVHTSYRLDLGKLVPENHNIERNIDYQIYATVRGLGATGFYAEIVPVDEYDLPLTWTPFEGYAVVGERVEDYGNNTNIWNSYSQYSGILKIMKNKTYHDALFRYGSVVALASTTTAGVFDAATDVIWAPEETTNNITLDGWGKIGYTNTGDIVHTLETIRQGKGDPCRLVGLSQGEIASGVIDNKLWRMPTSDEMRWLETARNGTFKSNGFYSFSTLLTPFTGSRSAQGDMIPNNATEGGYWSSSGVNLFKFGVNNSVTIAADDAQKAYSVRCIRTDIPQSVFNISGTSVNYKGGVVGIAMNDKSSVLVPYWRMALKDAADATMVSLGSFECHSSEPCVVTVQPLINPYIRREYILKLSGYGLDGVVHEREVSVAHGSLYHKVSVTWTSVPDLPFSDGYYRIPKSGAVITFKKIITPEPYINIYPNFDNLLWNIVTKYHTDVVNYDKGTQVIRNNESVITINENTWGHVLGLEFYMMPVVTNTYPPHESEILIFMQDK